MISVSSSPVNPVGRSVRGDGRWSRRRERWSGRPAPDAASTPPLHDRILDATVACIAHNGVAKTTIDDIARAAACSRATVYRAFAGGKDAIVVAAGVRELERFLDRLGHEIDACATLEDVLVTGICQGTRLLREHDALRYLVLNEPAVLRPMLAFDGLDPLLACAADFAETRLARFLDTGTRPGRRRVGGPGRPSTTATSPPRPATAVVDLIDEGAARHLVRDLPRSRPRSGPRPANPHTTQE